MPHCQPPRDSKNLPRIWLVSDARNDAQLAQILAHLPRGSGFIFRHYHLPPAKRRARFMALRRIARRYGHSIILSGPAHLARKWGADGIYGPAEIIAKGSAMIRLMTAHNLREMRRAKQCRASCIMLSPVFPTGSHVGGKPLGRIKFRALIAHAQVPVVALGGMNARRAKTIDARSWAAIDGLTHKLTHQSDRDGRPVL
ncbi:MAG: hypothetical protein RLY97_2192 [Pseudomonadota bacterium]|jgi:thiamine-phosphate pyrophosphorylase